MHTPVSISKRRNLTLDRAYHWATSPANFSRRIIHGWLGSRKTKGHGYSFARHRPPPLLPSVGCMKKKIPSRPHGLTSLDSSPLGDREAEATRDRRGGGEPSQGLRPATLPAVERRSPAAGSPAVAPPPGRPCSPVRLCCAASSEPPPQLLLAGSLPDLAAPDARFFPASLCGSLLLPGWWLAPSPNSQRYAKLFPPKFLTLTSEIGDELVD